MVELMGEWCRDRQCVPVRGCPADFGHDQYIDARYGNRTATRGCSNGFACRSMTYFTLHNAKVQGIWQRTKSATTGWIISLTYLGQEGIALVARKKKSKSRTRDRDYSNVQTLWRYGISPRWTREPSFCHYSSCSSISNNFAILIIQLKLRHNPHNGSTQIVISETWPKPDPTDVRPNPTWLHPIKSWVTPTTRPI